MGLLLSVLVACVGVVELLAFYSNVSRNFVIASNRTHLCHLTEKYLDNLDQHRQNLQNQIDSDTNVDEISKTDSADKSVSECNNTEETSLRPLPSNNIPLKENGINGRSRSPSPLQPVAAINDNKSLPNDVIEYENENRDDSLHKNAVIKYNDAKDSTFDFITTEQEFEASAKSHSRTPSPVLNKSTEQEIAFRRSPSPYPSLVLAVPRNSICKELLDNATVSVAEVDEEKISRSPTPEKIHMILESKHNTTEYWTNKVLVVPPAKLRSQETKRSHNSESLVQKSEQNNSITETVSKSNFTLESILSRDSEISSKNDEEIENEGKEYDVQFLDSVDGVKKKKFSRSNSSRRSRKKKAANVSNDNESKDDSLSSPSMPNNDAQTAKTLTEAANVLKNVNQEAGGPSVSSAGSSKDSKTAEPEPFWLIFSGEYTKAMNKDWHGQHFCCWQCDESLTGQRYVLRDEHPYCVACYESVFANACEKCSRIIGIDSKDLSYKDKHWHEACFLCTTCGESLVDRQFGSKGDRIYCGRCYDEQFASRCDGCHEIFRAGTKKMEYKTRQWHEKCFCCCVCKVPIGTQSFIPREQEIYCAKCYEEKFATRCIKCNKVITSGGVTYKNEPWHRECFTCTHCSKSLAGERFTSRDEKPYCAECFGELFAKRCFACNKPITGIGGTKFISFEDRHWHNDCFFCASCRTSLVGRGFITDQEDIICPECAKQKLM